MKNQPRVLMIGTSPQTKGGVSTVVSGYLLSSELNDRYLIKYLSTHFDGSWLKKLTAALIGYVRFAYLIIFFHPQIIHIHAASRASFYRKSVFVVVASLLKKPAVYHHHGGEFMKFFREESGPSMKKMIRLVLGKSSVIIALSSRWKENFKSIDPNLPVRILPNAVVIPSLPSRIDNNGKIVKILFMGRICKKKGIHDLIDAVEILATSALNFRVICGGDGDTDAWAEICSKKSIENLVSFKGWVSGKAKEVCYEQADIYVLPSYNEGLPMSVLEAISYGLPVVTTPVGGIPEVVNDGENGYLIRPGDVETLAKRLHLLICDRKLRLEMGADSRRLAEEKFDLCKVIEKLYRIYDNLLRQ